MLQEEMTDLFKFCIVSLILWCTNGFCAKYEVLYLNDYAVFDANAYFLFVADSGESQISDGVTLKVSNRLIGVARLPLATENVDDIELVSRIDIDLVRYPSSDLIQLCSTNAIIVGKALENGRVLDLLEGPQFKCVKRVPVDKLNFASGRTLLLSHGTVQWVRNRGLQEISSDLINETVERSKEFLRDGENTVVVGSAGKSVVVQSGKLITIIGWNDEAGGGWTTNRIDLPGWGFNLKGVYLSSSQPRLLFSDFHGGAFFIVLMDERGNEIWRATAYGKPVADPNLRYGLDLNTGSAFGLEEGGHLELGVLDFANRTNKRVRIEAEKIQRMLQSQNR